MTNEEHKKLLNDLKTAATDVDRMNIIIKLDQDYGGVLAERDKAVADFKTAQETSDKYAKLNNELWLQNSAQSQAGQATPPEGTNNEGTLPDGTEQPPTKLTYEDLAKKFEE
jgi:methionyl-tRNA formyltransferase